MESRYAVSYALNPRDRMPASGTGQYADPNLPLLRRHHEARPDDPKTWSAVGTVHLRLPFVRRDRYKGSKAGDLGVCRLRIVPIPKIAPNFRQRCLYSPNVCLRAFLCLISAYVSHAPQAKCISNNAAKGAVFLGRSQRDPVRDMMGFLCALVVIGMFVIWCDLTGAWNNVLRPIHARLPAYSKRPTTSL